MEKPPPLRRRKGRQIPILIVEDNADQWLIIRAALQQCFPEVEPIWFNNMDQTVAYLKTHAMDATKLPRLIVSDFYLPRREDGLALLEFMKDQHFYRKPPIIIISSSQDEEDIEKVYSYSVASYIIKPKTYHEWLNCFSAFRRYWWEVVTLPLRPQ